MTEVLAWTGAALSTLMGLSQVVRALRADRLEALSAATYWLTLANAAVWAAWAIVTDQPAAGVPALVNGPAAVLVLTRLGQARQGCATPRRTPTASSTSGPWAGSHSHERVVRPRRSSSMACARLTRGTQPHRRARSVSNCPVQAGSSVHSGATPNASVTVPR